MSLRSVSPPRKHLLVHLSQAVETLSLRKTPGSHVAPLNGALDGTVKLQFFDLSSREFDHFEKISNAIVRLDQGTYGSCVCCGGAIEADVLARTPWVTECLACGHQDSQPSSI